jgi:hypothetical protein
MLFGLCGNLIHLFEKEGLGEIFQINPLEPSAIAPGIALPPASMQSFFQRGR